VDSFTASSELGLAPALLAQVPDHSLTILDRNFFSALLLLQYVRSGVARHWLLRAKAKLCGRLLQRFTARDVLLEMQVSPEARKRDPTLPATWQVRAIGYQRRGFRPQVLLTSLLDPVRWPAHELAALYHERWECELGLDELKTEQLERQETLRSKAPWSVRQEVWGLMLGYNLLRRRAAASARAQKIAAVQISFVVMLRQLRDRWLLLALAGPEVVARLDAHEKQQRRRARLPVRRPARHYPRAVKLKMSPYLRKRPLARAA
jgi:hypothetical protein